MIQRTLFDTLTGKLFQGKAIIVTGPRQVGKTTLIRQVLELQESHLFLDGDDPVVRKLLDTPNTEQLKQIIGRHTILFIDEAQRINNIGLTLKIITDQFKHVQLIVSGSSSFDLRRQANEPLTGRKWEYSLYPISWEEWQNHTGYLKSEQDLENRLIYGMYPDVLNNHQEQREVLVQLVDSYLFKDVMAYGGIRKPEMIHALVQALAHQVGNEVNYNELSGLIGIDTKTIAAYIDVLEKAFVIFRLNPFSGNLRNEIKKNKKIFFYDNGVRNAVIGNFNNFSLREDTGALWENFIISERLKQLAYKRKYARSYFWRTKQQQEVDYVEESNGRVYGYEIKWNPKKKGTLPSTFTENYNASTFNINRNNFREFVIISN